VSVVTCSWNANTTLERQTGRPGETCNSGYTASSDWMIVNNEVQKMWTEAIVAWFKILSRFSLEGLRKTTKYLRHDSYRPGRDSDWEYQEYGSGASLYEPNCSAGEIKLRTPRTRAILGQYWYLCEVGIVAIHVNSYAQLFHDTFLLSSKGISKWINKYEGI
jgi:hypothetical protein